MTTVNNWYAFSKVDEPQESELTANVQGETLTVQVEGDATSVSLTLLGQVDFAQEEFIPISGVNVSGFKPINSITANGIYIFPIENIARFKFNLTAVDGGAVTVFCRIGKGD